MVEPKLPESQNVLWKPAWIVFISNACVMTIELVAGRLIAPYVGVSLYTWTSIIGVILAGISVGNFIGGKLADRFATRRLLGGIFIAAGLGSWSVLLTVGLFGEAGLPRVEGLPLIARMVMYITLIFAFPSILLGMISPLVVKLSLNDLAHSGSTIGRIYAASALGSIVGTFATGFYLVSAFGTRTILLGVGAVLVAMGLLFGKWFAGQARPTIAASAALIGVFVSTLAFPGQLRGPCLRETDYFCIRVRDETRSDGHTYRVLTLDRLVHSYSALDDPTRLVYGYEKIGAEVLAYMAERHDVVDAFFIGGGGYTLPRYMEAAHPASVIDVAEIDPVVTEVAYGELGLARDSQIRSFNQDARLYLLDLNPARKYNLIIGDAFNDFSVPYHLTTHEFNALVRAHLSDDGIYMLNLIDGDGLPFVAAYLRTLRQTFVHIAVIPTTKNWRQPLRTTFIVLASPQPIDLVALRQFTGHDDTADVSNWLISEDDVEEIAARATFDLTDDFVPADNLLAGMFEASAR